MKRYLPNRTEEPMLIVGICLGISLGIWFPDFLGTFPIYAPLLLLVSLFWYFYYKHKQIFKEDLKKAHNAKELVMDE
jgi:uncharacterized membrane protein YfcA